MKPKAPAYDLIYEALLEMHFHSAIIKHFADVYGANFLKLYKPSPKQEAWVGFDQGYVYTSVTTGQLFNDLQDAIAAESSSVYKLFIGYFMQFKVVRKFRKRSRFTPTDFTAPYLRSELDLEPNKTTGISQHETLLRLSNIAGASVCYACGMLFDIADVYAPPDLRKLRCVIVPPPIDIDNNDRHFIAFRHETDTKPKWCSDPVEAESLSFDEWASPNSKNGPKALSPNTILDLIKSAVHELDQEDKPTSKKKARTEKKRKEKSRKEIDNVTRLLPESFTLLEFEAKKEGVK